MTRDAILSRATLLPIGLVSSMLVSAVGLTFWVTVEMTQLQSSISELRKELSGLRTEAKERSEDRWTKTDMRMWTQLIQAKNPEVQIVVPE